MIAKLTLSIMDGLDDRVNLSLVTPTQVKTPSLEVSSTFPEAFS